MMKGLVQTAISITILIIIVTVMKIIAVDGDYLESVIHLTLLGLIHHILFGK